MRTFGRSIELEVAKLANEVGFQELSMSHQVAPFIKLVAHGETTVLDAYLNPILRQYLRALSDSLVAYRAGRAKLRINIATAHVRRWLGRSFRVHGQGQLALRTRWGCRRIRSGGDRRWISICHRI